MKFFKICETLFVFNHPANFWVWCRIFPRNVPKIYNVTFIFSNFDYFKKRRRFQKFIWILRNQKIHLKKKKIGYLIICWTIDFFFTNFLITFGIIIIIIIIKQKNSPEEPRTKISGKNVSEKSPKRSSWTPVLHSLVYIRSWNVIERKNFLKFSTSRLIFQAFI